MNNDTIQRKQRLLSDVADQLLQLIELRDATYKKLDFIRERQGDTIESEQQNVRCCYSEEKSRIVKLIINRYKVYLYVTENCCTDEAIRCFTSIAMSLESDFNVNCIIDFFKKIADSSKLEFNVTESPYGKSVIRKQYNALSDSYYITPLVL